ncbi:MAG: hypothetical protein LBM13_03850 [Candidatus Ancillula sp.]|nr:hypothetical protein [Candidatus Ancillula sp.]
MNKALVEEVIKNVISGLDCPDFDKEDWSRDDSYSTITVSTGADGTPVIVEG